MPFYRLTGLFQFAGTPPCGFSESWDFDAASESLAVSQANSWPKERRALMSHDWSIIGVRLSLIEYTSAPPACNRKYTPVQQQICVQPVEGSIQSDCDTPWAAVLVAISTKGSVLPVPAPPRPRMWQLRGIPDSWWTGELSIPVADKGAIAKYVKYLVDQLQAGHVTPNAGCTAAQLQPYVSSCVKRISNRQIGRPFGLLRGRRVKEVAS